MPTGLCWHPIIMAPVLLLAYYLFNNIVIKGFVVLEALFIGNSTVLIAVVLCVVLDVVHGLYIFTKSGRAKKIVLFGIIGVIVLAVLVLSCTSIPTLIVEKIGFVIQRITGETTDLSTMAHIRYYTSVEKVFDVSTFSQILFGYGEGCSGYTMSFLYGQYSSLGSWAVETDIMNTLYSRGIIGFCAFLGFLAQIIVKGRKIDFRYITMTLCLLVAGITYNVQFSWVFFLELLMVISLEQGVNFYGEKSREGMFLW